MFFYTRLDIKVDCSYRPQIFIGSMIRGILRKGYCYIHIKNSMLSSFDNVIQNFIVKQSIDLDNLIKDIKNELLNTIKVDNNAKVLKQSILDEFIKNILNEFEIFAHNNILSQTSAFRTILNLSNTYEKIVNNHLLEMSIKENLIFEIIATKCDGCMYCRKIIKNSYSDYTLDYKLDQKYLNFAINIFNPSYQDIIDTKKAFKLAIHNIGLEYDRKKYKKLSIRINRDIIYENGTTYKLIHNPTIPQLENIQENIIVIITTKTPIRINTDKQSISLQMVLQSIIDRISKYTNETIKIDIDTGYIEIENNLKYMQLHRYSSR